MCDLSIVILVWQDRAFLRACLDSLAAARQDLRVEIVLVENGITLQKRNMRCMIPFRFGFCTTKEIAALPPRAIKV